MKPHVLINLRNEFLNRKPKKQKEEDIAICDCQYDCNNPDNACGDRCLNVLTNTECTRGQCACGRGWGLLSGENIKVGQFVIEYRWEVISWKEAKQRSQAYEATYLSGDNDDRYSVENVPLYDSDNDELRSKSLNAISPNVPIAEKDNEKLLRNAGDFLMLAPGYLGTSPAFLSKKNY
ncbi:hypothetical protein ZIOFF_070808 [Zingiber officinale]|uniref:AWS domain-containing protein n=1 Tax=Zingiber officinale TaxID=94328 RepID=A0A8J5ENA4_ZINOF|nr:hypothetical protein ZIOFF_070808 [Zingiber officinale]